MTIRRRATILPGGKIQIQDPQFPAGAEAELLVTFEEPEEAALSGEFEPAPGARPFWERIVELGARIPSEEWERVPKDLSKNLDHYLYGAEKEEE
ncbi:MAG TPA: hypothetical protein VGH73_21800 [Thermoanaerobaculia bacterium]|jgi:hypothetical protein